MYLQGKFCFEIVKLHAKSTKIANLLGSENGRCEVCCMRQFMYSVSMLYQCHIEHSNLPFVSIFVAHKSLTKATYSKWSNSFGAIKMAPFCNRLRIQIRTVLWVCVFLCTSAIKNPPLIGCMHWLLSCVHLVNPINDIQSIFSKFYLYTFDVEKVTCAFHFVS